MRVVTKQLSYLKLSIRLLRVLSVPLGLFPSSSLLKAYFVVLSLFIFSSLFFHSSCLLTTSRIPSWPCLKCISTFLTLSTLHTPSILLNTLICVAWTLDSCCIDSFHTSHLYTSVGNMVAFMTFNLVFLLSSSTQHCFTHPSNNSYCTSYPYFLLHI